MKRGFSLVELSIVLVILGLLTGGILSGQSLIHAAELRRTTSLLARYQAAIYSFRDKYMEPPGDFTKATDFWTSAGGTGMDSTCLSAQTSGSRATCNGDGDWQIFDLAGIGTAERFLAWKHLANAGLVEGSYTGKSNGAPNTVSFVPGDNAPAGPLSNNFYDIVHLSTATFSTLFVTGTALDSNFLSIFSTRANWGAMKPEDAWNIDKKLDDGMPATGSIFTPKKTGFLGPNCASSDLITATYDFTQTDPNCMVVTRFE